MPDLTPSGAPTDDEISLLSIASALLRWRRTIVVCALMGAALGVATGLLSTRRFLSSALFAPQAGNDQMASGLALAASQLGIRVASTGSGWPAAVYVELLASRGLLEQLARDTVTVAELGNRRYQLMDLLEVQGATPEQRLETAVRQLRAMVVATEVKRLGAVQLSVTTKWSSVSYALAERLIALVNKFNTQTRQSQASAERQFVQERAREAEVALRDAEDRMQTFLQRNRTATSPELVFDRDRLQREITLRQQAYTSLLQSQEEAKIREVRDTPVITILERPTRAAVGESRHSAAKGAMGLIVGVLVGLLGAAIGTGRRSAHPAAQEFFATLDDATPRLLRRRRK